MHGRAETVGQLARNISESLPGNVDCTLCPAFPHIPLVYEVVAGSRIGLGAQDCAPVADDAARTGDVSASMLADLGCHAVITGHSERRAQHRENDSDIRQKALCALQAGLTPIVCVGESEEIRLRSEAEAFEFVARQARASLPEDAGAAARCVLAYEPVWAIGTGNAAGLNDIAAAGR